MPRENHENHLTHEISHENDEDLKKNNVRIMKLMKIMNSTLEFENHECLRIPRENHENHVNVRIQCGIMKIFKKIYFYMRITKIIKKKL